MWFHSLLASWKSGRSRSRRPQPRPARRGTRLVMDHLEDRMLPSTYCSAASVLALIADINAANMAGGANTISLTAPTTSPYVLTAVNNTTNGATGLPVIAANDNLTILGNGYTIERSAATGTPAFRLLEVASGGSLTLGNLTLQGGLAQSFYGFGGIGAADGGGAIISQGTLVLNGVTVQDNMAVGGLEGYFGYNGGGGSIFSFGGSVTLEGGTVVQNNEALGGSVGWTAYAAGNGYGGGLYASGGTVTVTNATLDNNAAVGGLGESYGGGLDDGAASKNGYGYGGGLFAYRATVTLTNATLDGNVARVATLPNFGLSGPWPGIGGGAYGGGLGLLISSATLTNCTVQGNSAQFGRSGSVAGGGLCVTGGKVTLTSDTVESNSANIGGGLYLGPSLSLGGVTTVTLESDTVESNKALSGGGMYVGYVGAGTVTLTNDTVDSIYVASAYATVTLASDTVGGLFIAKGATVYIDAFTLAHVINIYGTYIET